MPEADRQRGWRRDVQRPPWTDETTIRGKCHSCGDCIGACPEAILTGGPAGTPVLDFSMGACTFCGACADACDEDVFADTSDRPWALTAEISTACLLRGGVACRSCTDTCDDDALKFDLHGGSVGSINVDRTACTGCGACITTCPAAAITVKAITPRTKELSA